MNPGRSMNVKICVYCGKEFHPWADNPEQKYCSRDCISRFRAKERAKNSIRYCKHCGEMFMRKTGSKTEYCSECIKEGWCFEWAIHHERNELDDCAQKARDAGMSYGKWRASQHRYFRPSVPVKIVKEFGRPNEKES